MLNRLFFNLVVMAVASGTAATLGANDEIISLAGNFGSFIELGAGAAEVRALGPDRAEPAAMEEQRVASTWHYFSSRGIRVRVCDDDQRVAAINAVVSPVTQKYLTEAGVRVGDDLERTGRIYADRLQSPPETDGAIWYVREPGGSNQLTFGFSPGGDMRWVALGALRDNGWTCGVPVIPDLKE